MDWLWTEIEEWWPALLFLFNMLLIVTTIIWVLMTKTDATSAVAWCLVVLLVPFLGALLFVFFGYQHVHRPLKRKRRHKKQYRRAAAAATRERGASDDGEYAPEDSPVGSMQRLADRMGAGPVTVGNQVDFYFESLDAFAAMLDAIAAAQHHIHAEFFIILADELGERFLKAMAERARQGIEVRLLYDAMGSHRLPWRLVKPLIEAGGKVDVFLSLNPLRRRLQINMRNHRKILVVDGIVGFVGGLNIGDEYVGKNTYFGYWRDTHLRVRGPAVTHIQAVFCEDWDFAAGENLQEASAKLAGCYFPTPPAEGDCAVQVIDSGPDRDLKAIREIYFAAILKARRRVWIATPYFVPDAGILDALKLAAYLGVDVRLLCQFRADHTIPQAAAQYYWANVLEAGVKVYQYARGMMHSKVVLIDDDWASVGSANLDNRSLHLNFELNCLIYSPRAVKELAEAFERDFRCSILLDHAVFAGRPFTVRLLENACRLLSPVL